MTSALQLDLTVGLALQLAGADRNLAEARLDLVDQARALGGQSFHVVADKATNQSINLQGITTASELLVLSSTPISLTINGSATLLLGRVFLFSGAAITSLAASNSSGIDAQVQVLLAGS